MIQTTDADGRINDTVYDAQGRVVYTDDPHRTGDATDGNHNLYDSAGRVNGSERQSNVVITIQSPAQHPLSVLTSAGTLISSTSSVYDALGRMTQSTDAIGNAPVRRSPTTTPQGD